MRLIPGSGRCPGGGPGNPLQYSCLETPMDRGARRPTSAQGRAESDTNDATKLPDQGWNLCLLQRNLSPNRWATRQVSRNVHFKRLKS